MANSRYATIREVEGRCYLYLKTIERAHTPNKLWERKKLSRNYAKALKQIDSTLEHWPSYLIHKNKQRLTKITQYLLRMRRMALNPDGIVLERADRQRERIEEKKEAKALRAADIEGAIEKELLARLKQVRSVSASCCLVEHLQPAPGAPGEAALALTTAAYK